MVGGGWKRRRLAVVGWGLWGRFAGNGVFPLALADQQARVKMPCPLKASEASQSQQLEGSTLSPNGNGACPFDAPDSRALYHPQPNLVQRYTARHRALPISHPLSSLPDRVDGRLEKGAAQLIMKH
jgi:hypothetical protein